jgi:hypothetical protein
MRSPSSCLISLSLVALLSGGGLSAGARPSEGASVPPGGPREPGALRAVAPDRLAGNDHGFERGLGETRETLLLAEEGEETRISYLRGEELVLTSRYRRGPAGGFEASLAVGEDTLGLFVMTDLRGGPERLLLDLNGAAGELAPEELEALAEEVSAGGSPLPSPLARPDAGALRDPAGFRLALGRYGDLLDEVHRLAREGSLPGAPPEAMTCCVWKCFLCAGSIFVYVKTVGTLVVGCGPGAVITLGGSCFMAILEHMYTSGLMVGACSRCLKCVEGCLEPTPVSGRAGL